MNRGVVGGTTLAQLANSIDVPLFVARILAVQLAHDDSGVVASFLVKLIPAQLHIRNFVREANVRLADLFQSRGVGGDREEH